MTFYTTLNKPTVTWVLVLWIGPERGLTLISLRYGDTSTLAGWFWQGDSNKLSMARNKALTVTPPREEQPGMAPY